MRHLVTTAHSIDEDRSDRIHLPSDPCLAKFGFWAAVTAVAPMNGMAAFRLGSSLRPSHAPYGTIIAGPRPRAAGSMPAAAAAGESGDVVVGISHPERHRLRPTVKTALYDRPPLNATRYNNSCAYRSAPAAGHSPSALPGGNPSSRGRGEGPCLDARSLVRAVPKDRSCGRGVRLRRVDRDREGARGAAV